MDVEPICELGGSLGPGKRYAMHAACSFVVTSVPTGGLESEIEIEIENGSENGNEGWHGGACDRCVQVGPRWWQQQQQQGSMAYVSPIDVGLDVDCVTQRIAKRE